jgi:hypothetical protein
MGWWQRVRTGVFSKEKSLATGVILGFMAWALMRLVDGIAAYDTLEYHITHRPTPLADGRAGFVYRVKFTNLAGDTTVQSMRATVASMTPAITFSVDRRDSRCAMQPPAGGKVVECEALESGFNFTAPPLLAGTYAGLEVKYTRPSTSSEIPILRLVLAEGQNFRLVEAGLATLIVRNQNGVLFGFLLLAFIALVASLAAGTSPPRKDA